MRLWPSGITLYCTDEVWVNRAWNHLMQHYRKHGSFHWAEVRHRFDRYDMEWNLLAVAYLAADIRRNGA